jgi:hypothetical protein
MKIKKIYSTILLLGVILFSSCESKNSPENSDLGIVEGKIESYFASDTSFEDETIRFYPKFHKDSILYKPYNIDFEYGEKEGWQLNFKISHFDKYVTVFPSKGLLLIDDYEISYETVLRTDMGDMGTLHGYHTSNQLSSREILEKISTSKTVSFTAIGDDKQNFTWSPKIIEDSKKAIEYFDNLKSTKPSFK